MLEKEWFTAAELVALALPDLPGTKSAMIRMAARDGWQDRANLAGAPLARKRMGRGGGWEYHYALLPARAQARLVRDARPSAPAEARDQARTSDLWQWYERQPEKKKQAAREKLAALLAIDTLERGGLQVNLAVHEVARARGKSARTLYNWRDEVAGAPREDWLPRLCPRHAGRTVTVDCDHDAWEFYKRAYLTDEKRQAAYCYDLLKDAAAKHGWTIPSARTLERRLTTEIPRAIRVFWREGQEAASRLYPHQERDRTMFHAMEAVNADGHKFDVFVKWPDGTIGRPMMLAIQDLYSNKFVAWRVDRSENAELVRLAFRDMFEDYGIPDLAFLDNGRGFAAKCLTGGQPTRYRFKVKPEDPQGILTQLGVDVHWTRPYSGQSKPIERAFGELCQRIAKHPAFEGAYTGNRPEAKPESYGSRAVDLDTFLAVVGQGILAYNARPNRNTRVCGRVRSFDDAFAASYAEAPIRKAAPEHLRMCLLAVEAVRANAQSGSVSIQGNRYWSEALVELAGHPLTVRFDPEDMHDGIHVYRQDGVYVGFAECLEAAGFKDATEAREHARKRKAYRKGLKEMAALERSMTLDQLIAAMPDIEDPDTPEAKVIRPFIPARGSAAVKLAPEQAASTAKDIDASEFDRLFRAGLHLVEGGRDD